MCQIYEPVTPTNISKGILTFPDEEVLLKLKTVKIYGSEWTQFNVQMEIARFSY